MKKLILSLTGIFLLSAPLAAQELDKLVTPTSSWLVGPATLAEHGSFEGKAMPCLMANSFSNTYEIRFSGGGEAIMAMSLNVRRQTFEPGQSYLIQIGFTPDKLTDFPAQAFSGDTVIINLDEEKEFYKNLKTAHSFFIKLGDSEMEFSLLGAHDGVKRMEACYQPQPGSGVREAQVAAPVSGESITGIKKLDNTIDQNSGMVIESHMAGSALPQMPEEAKPEALHQQDISDPELAPVTDKPPIPTEEKTAAVADNKPRDILAHGGSAVSEPGKNPRMRWRVMKGANLRGILDVWAQSVDTRLVWSADQDFEVPESLAMEGTLEDAVGILLGQYPQDRIRPVSRIDLDPVLKQKTLIIEADKPVAPAVTEGNYAPIIAP